MSLKLLIDMNLSPQWVSVFERNGWDVKHWSKVGDPHATDSTIMDWAKKNHYVYFLSHIFIALGFSLRPPRLCGEIFLLSPIFAEEKILDNKNNISYKVINSTPPFFKRGNRRICSSIPSILV